MHDPTGTFVWSELETTDAAAARRFYEAVVGWSCEGFGGPAPQYWIWKAGAAGVGGLVQGERPPHWLPYVYARDVDALVQRATALGGSCATAAHDVPTVGRIAVIADPQGAILAAIAPEGADSPPRAPHAGEVVWRELLCDDPSAALRFYGALLGWRELRTHELGANGTYHVYGTDGRELGGVMKRPAGYPRAPHFLLYVDVADLDGAVARVRECGGGVWMGPMAIPTGMRVVQCADPQGAVFALHGK